MTHQSIQLCIRLVASAMPYFLMMRGIERIGWEEVLSFRWVTFS
jgi:hypothetical protein